MGAFVLLKKISQFASGCIDRNVACRKSRTCQISMKAHITNGMCVWQLSGSKIVGADLCTVCKKNIECELRLFMQAYEESLYTLNNLLTMANANRPS